MKNLRDQKALSLYLVVFVFKKVQHSIFISKDNIYFGWNTRKYSVSLDFIQFNVIIIINLILNYRQI
jgi:hypothetical protein